MQRLGIQFRGARFENMVPKPPRIHIPIVPGSHKSQVWAAPGAYRQWKGWKVSAIVAFNALQRHTLFSTESINLSLAVCEAQLLLPWKKPQPFPYFMLMPFWVAQSNPQSHHVSHLKGISWFQTH